MRRTSYILTFLAVVVTLVFNILSSTKPEWLTATSKATAGSGFEWKTITNFGLMERCSYVEILSGTGFEYNDYSCRPYPTAKEDGCDKENRTFCAFWHTAGYANYLAIMFAAAALLALPFGLTSQAMRRKVWKVAAGFVFLHAVFQIIAFAIITDLFRTSHNPYFRNAKPGAAYIFAVVSWVSAILITFFLVITGISAQEGHHWAAGRTAYTPIH